MQVYNFGLGSGFELCAQGATPCALSCDDATGLAVMMRLAGRNGRHTSPRGSFPTSAKAVPEGRPGLLWLLQREGGSSAWRGKRCFR